MKKPTFKPETTVNTSRETATSNVQTKLKKSSSAGQVVKQPKINAWLEFIRPQLASDETPGPQHDY